MPPNVVWFERLMIAAVFCGLAGVFLFWQREGVSSTAELAIAAGLVIVNFGLMLLLIWLIARRRKGWVRYVIAVLFLLGLPYALKSAQAELMIYPVEGGLSVVQLALQGVALVLVFTGNARAWFAKPAAAPAPSS
jgi:hypothetical protein